MKGQRSKPPNARPPFNWHHVAWTLIMAAAAYGIYFLHQHRIATEEQLMLLIFVLVPVVAFLLSGRGQDRSNDGDVIWKDRSGNR